MSVARKTKVQLKGPSLLEAPVTKAFSLQSARAEVDVVVDAFPNGWIRYNFTWNRRPSGGLVAMVEGQVNLKAGSLTRLSLAKVRCFSDGRVYCNNGASTQAPIKKRLVKDTDDFSFSARIIESSI